MRLRFGDFVFDAALRELTGPAGVCHLSTKAFLLLEVLLRAAPRALSKEELYAAVWGDAFVDRANLPNLVAEVRTALGDERKDHRYIRTIHGYGYAFAGAVVEDAGRPRGAVSLICWHSQEFPVRGAETVIGRGAEADIAIKSSAVSRRHARLLNSGGEMLIEDLGSKNGTFVRGERVAEAMPLHDGDEIRLGRVVLTYRATPAHDSTVTAMTDER
jgi:DNA-binding winged helix-turn-helix (wHTH) protein